MSYNRKMAKVDVIEEDLEITAATAGAAPMPLPGRVISIFPAFAHRNFQLYFAGQSISLIGFWLQQIGIGWFVFQLTHSPFWVGTTAAVGGLPFLVFTAFAGVLVDKFKKQKLLIFTQSSEAILAVFLGLLVLFSQAGLPLVLIIVFVNGIVAAIDLPARLTFIVEMVGKKDLPSAIPLNISIFNAARFVGPALAGFLIAKFGVGWTFILNGISFLPAILAIMMIRPIYLYAGQTDKHPWESLKEGIKYSFSHPLVFYMMILGTASAIFLWPYQTLMPVIADRVFASGAQGLGSLLSAAGAGSLAGAIFTSAQSRRANKGALIFFGLLTAGLAFMAFSLNKNFIAAHALLFIAGFGMLIFISSVNTLVQLASPDHIRGRVMAVYLTMFVGIMPLGNAVMGVLAEKTSSIFAIGIGAAGILLVGAYFYSKGIFKNLVIESSRA